MRVPRRAPRVRWRDHAFRASTARVRRHLVEVARRGASCACAWHARLHDVAGELSSAIASGMVPR